MGGRADDLRVRRFTERVIRDHGAVPLAFLFETLVPLARLRELAAELGVSPKGFRVEKASAGALAAALAECKEPDQLDKIVAQALAGARTESKRVADKSKPDDEAQKSAAAATSSFWEQESKRLHSELERARESLQRAAARESELRKEAQARDDELGQLRVAMTSARNRSIVVKPDATSVERELQRQLRELQIEVEGRAEADEAVRRQLAADRTRLRDLEAEIEEITALLPKGRKRKAPPPEPEPSKRLHVPWFQPSFYKSLDGMDRRSVERAIEAVLLFCTEGHSYPGLEVKQLGGQDMWSMRASLGLRVYFRHRSDGDIDVLELGNREDQNTTLRRLKER